MGPLAARVAAEPFNLVAAGIFALAILHTFAAARFTQWSRQVQQSHEERSRALGRQPVPHVGAEVMQFLGEVEVAFGLWAVVLAAAIALRFGWPTMTEYVNTTVNYTEPLFVVVIMALASTRPVVTLAEGALRAVAGSGGHARGMVVRDLTIGPLLGSFITEPGP